MATANTPAHTPARPAEAPPSARVQASLLPYLDAAYGLARWLVGDELLAEDIVQHAYQLAFQQIDHPEDAAAKPWLLAIVRRTAHDWLARHRQQSAADASMDEAASAQTQDRNDTAELADTLRLLKPGRAQVNAALGRLDLPLREALVLQEIEALAPEQIALVLAVPKAEVLARLARARRQLALHLRDGDRQPQHER